MRLCTTPRRAASSESVPQPSSDFAASRYSLIFTRHLSFADQLQQDPRLVGLRDVMVEPGHRPQDLVSRLLVETADGNEQRAALPVALANIACDIPAACVGQGDVKEHHVGIEGLERRHYIAAVVDATSIVAIVAQQLHEREHGIVLVVSDEDPKTTKGWCHGRRFYRPRGPVEPASRSDFH